MDLKQRAEGAPYHLVTKIEECSLGRFWVVQLDAGFDVFQTPEDGSLDEPNAWLRLKQFCEDTGAKPMNVARAGKDSNPATQINLDPMADGYFYARRIRKLMSGHPAYAGYTDESQGIGQLNEGTLRIVWELEDGRFDIEERPLDDNPKSQPISLIRR